MDMTKGILCNKSRMEHFIQTPQIKGHLESWVSLSTLEDSVSQTVGSLIKIER